MRMLDLLSSTMIAFSLSFAISASAAEPCTVCGIWQLTDEHGNLESRLNIRNCADVEDRLCGTIVWLSDDKLKIDPEPEKKEWEGRRVLGLEAVCGMRASLNTGSNWSGAVYSLKIGEYIKATMVFNQGSETIRIEGCKWGNCESKVGRRTEHVDPIEAGVNPEGVQSCSANAAYINKLSN